jgi:hypothetical protein
MCGVIVVDAGRSWSTNLGRDAYIHDYFLGYRHNYFLFYQLPNSNLFTHRMLFSWEKPLVNTTAPGSTFIIRSILFSYTKNTKNICCIFYLLFYYQSIIYLFNLVTWPPRDWQPLVCVGCEGLCFVCRCYLRGVAWFSYWIDNLGLLT